MYQHCVVYRPMRVHALDSNETINIETEVFVIIPASTHIKLEHRVDIYMRLILSIRIPACAHLHTITVGQHSSLFCSIHFQSYNKHNKKKEEEGKVRIQTHPL